MLGSGDQDGLWETAIKCAALMIANNKSRNFFKKIFFY